MCGGRGYGKEADTPMPAQGGVGIGTGGEVGGVGTRYHAWPKSYDHGPSHLYNAGTEHVGYSPTRQTLLAPSAKRREMFGESHEG